MSVHQKEIPFERFVLTRQANFRSDGITHWLSESISFPAVMHLISLYSFTPLRCSEHSVQNTARAGAA